MRLAEFHLCQCHGAGGHTRGPTFLGWRDPIRSRSKRSSLGRPIMRLCDRLSESLCVVGGGVLAGHHDLAVDAEVLAAREQERPLGLQAGRCEAGVVDVGRLKVASNFHADPITGRPRK